MSDRISECKQLMEKSLEHLKLEFSKMRVGRASVAMIDAIRVDVYGSSMTLKEVAALSTPDAKTIAIQPWDKSLMNEIEKSIMAANLGLTPINDGKLIRINLPPMTEERRKDFVKQIKKHGEDAKVSVRNERRDILDAIKAKDKATLSEDAMKRLQDEIQKVTDHFTTEVDKLVESKSKEVMTI